MSLKIASLIGFFSSAWHGVLDIVYPDFGSKPPVAIREDKNQVVKSLIGISAEDLDKKYQNADQKNFIRSLFYRGGTSKRPVYFIKNPTTGQRFQAGYFEEVPLAKLAPQAFTSGKAEAVNTLRFHLLANNYDIGALQADPFFNGVLFQVASNFSALEPVGLAYIPEQYTLDDYIFDMSQGPKAALSAFPGIFYRMYGIFQQEGPKYANHAQSLYGAKNPFDWRQTADRQVELLSETGIPVQNGYILLYQRATSKGATSNVEDVTFDNNQETFLNKIKEKKSVQDFSDIVSPMKIGIHRDIEVLFGDQNQRDWRHERLNRNDQIIHQVFIAALDLGSTNVLFRTLEKLDGYKQPVEFFAQAILRAGYEGTLGAAHRLGVKKVVLTQVGGGVFENEPKWVQDAVISALKKYQHLDIDIYLNIFHRDGSDAAQKVADVYIQEANKEGIVASITTLDALKQSATSQAPPPAKTSWWGRFKGLFRL